MSSLPLVELLHRALQEPLGIIVSTNDPERLRVRLYEARRTALNPAFEVFSFVPSRINPTSELWILKKIPSTSSEEPSANG